LRERTEEEPKKKIISLRCFDFSFFTLPLRPLKDKNALNLIIDIGNTAAKVALFDGGEMVEVLTESNQSLDCLEVLCAKYPVEQGIVATVIDLSERVLAALVALPFPLLWLDSKTPLPVTNLYETPETLGYDRMAAVVGANEQYPRRDILVIDAGTCITYEFIDSKGQYHGGNISPGMQMRFKALNQFTGRLPLIDSNGRKLPMGRDTETAIRAGVLKGMEYEISGYIESMKHKYPELLVFLTGGDDFSFDSSVKSIIFADRFLVLKGLNRILNYNNGRI
jgi:type III pantothenate kinase